jgi:hemerythrin superfamily protein
MKLSTISSLPRRQLIVAAAGVSAFSALQESVAQTAAAGGDWFAMVKAHHLLISKTFDQLLESRSKLNSRRDRLKRLISYQLTAHSVAEENVIYPALAQQGLVTESDKLYLDQAHAKVMNAALDMADAKGDAAWFAKVEALRAAVLQHAQQDEEAQLYPQLQQKLDAAMNAKLTQAYQREFSSVKPEPLVA